MTKVSPKTFFCLIFLEIFIFKAYASNAHHVPDVKVHAKKNTPALKASGMETVQFKQKEIQDQPVLNLSQFLHQQQSTVRLVNHSADSSQTAMSIRGFGDNAQANSLILVDGFPLVNPSLLAPNFNSIFLDDIERIEIVEGSQGTLWGDQAVGGVVNIVTRHPNKKISDINIGAGSFHHYFLSGLFGDHFQNGIYFKAFAFQNQTKNFRHHQNQIDQTGFLQAGYDYKNGIINFNAQRFDHNIKFPGGLNQDDYDHHPRMANNFKNVMHEQINSFQIFNKQALNANWILNTRLSKRVINTDGFVMMPFVGLQGSNWLSSRLEGRLEKNKILFGYDFQNSFYHLKNKFNHNRVTSNQQDVYGQVMMPLKNKWQLTIGSRLAFQNNDIEKVINHSVLAQDHVWVTEIGLVYHFNQALQFYVRRDGNFSFPKANEETWTPVGTDHLKTQTGLSYEAGGIWQSRNHIIKFNIYDLLLKNEIGFDPTETLDEPFGTFQNFKKTSRRGASVSDQFRLNKKLNLFGQINFVKAVLLSGPFSGKSVPAVPSMTGNISMRYRLDQHWMTQWTTLYTGERYPSEDYEHESHRLKPYYLSSFAIQYSLKHFLISLQIENILNQTYASYVLFDSKLKTLTYYPAAGRSLLLSIKVNL